jgi:hypothetical protein
VRAANAGTVKVPPERQKKYVAYRAKEAHDEGIAEKARNGFGG